MDRLIPKWLGYLILIAVAAALVGGMLWYGSGLE